jgi:leucyl-tRNA synthetase
MVPAHDERDFEFAQKFKIPIIQVIEGNIPHNKKVISEGILTNSATFNGLTHTEGKEKIINYLETTNT